MRYVPNAKDIIEQTYDLGPKSVYITSAIASATVLLGIPLSVWGSYSFMELGTQGSPLLPGFDAFNFTEIPNATRANAYDNLKLSGGGDSWFVNSTIALFILRDFLSELYRHYRFAKIYKAIGEKPPRARLIIRYLIATIAAIGNFVVFYLTTQRANTPPKMTPYMSSIFDKMNPWFQPYDMYASGANAFLAGFYGGYKLTIAFEYLLRGLRRLLLRCCNRPDRTGELIDTAVIQANLSNQLEAYREDPALHTVSGAALATDMTRRNRIYLTASRSDVADEAASLLDNDAADDHLDSDGASVGDSRDAEAPRHLPTASPWRHRGITAARWLLGHAPMQFCMIVSVVSWFLYTADQMHEDIQKIPHLDNDYAKYGLSFAAFISPAFQYIYFTFDLTNSLLNIIGNLLKRQPISTLSKALMAPFLVLTPIYLLAAYISSNTALDLNDDYDLNALWFTIATLIGGTVANGYTLFALTSDALNTLNDHLFFTPQQRRANNAVKESLEFIEYSAKAA